ncbi:hypothetical protein B0A79_05365 [Flavobacterium piscis]|uniref:Uncharacterized protein n=1 Tax=Flavobacterium piscis TaxID=1114874 RepID=A0ABX2XR88_9FLAO|nr:hypothetical protein FLP_06055 [Flavobacterium piscis]OXG06844.1 hypothetical protein B0A79_05365 [Flavobacterium piscis]
MIGVWDFFWKILRIARWHADDTDSLARKRGFIRIFFVGLFAFFVISTEGRDHTRSSTKIDDNLVILT